MKHLLNFATADPNPINEPKVNSACIPDNRAASFGTTTDPIPVFIANPVKSASCEVTPAAVPCAEVMACPVGDTSSFGATAVP